MSMENWWNDNDREKIKVMTEKPVPTAFSTTNPTGDYHLSYATNESTLSQIKMWICS
jgi:hypothetical protein